MPLNYLFVAPWLCATTYVSFSGGRPHLLDGAGKITYPPHAIHLRCPLAYRTSGQSFPPPLRLGLKGGCPYEKNELLV